MALAKNSTPLQRGPVLGSRYDMPVAPGVRIFRGALVGVTEDYAAVPAGHVDCAGGLGIAMDPADNRTGQKGSKRVIISTGIFNMTEALAVASVSAPNIKGPVYASDDDTLTLTALNGEVLIGTIDAIDEEGVWIKI